MSNTFQTNSFIEGMNLDIDITAIPESQYRYAENVRILTNKDGTSGVLQNIQSTRLIQGGDFMDSDEVVLATAIINQYGIILTADPYGITRIYRVEGYEEGLIQHTLVLKGRLNYNRFSRVKIVANYESDSIIKMYFTDGESSIRSLNIMSDRYVQNSEGANPALDEEGNIKNPDSLDIIPSTLLVAPKIVSLGTNGSLLSGQVQYTYQLYNERGSSTGYAPASNTIHLTSSNTTTDSAEYQGVNKDVNTGKSANIVIDLSNVVSGLFDKCRIVRIQYVDNTEIANIDVIDEIDLPSGNSLTYTDLGNKTLNTVTIEEFNANTGSDFTVATLEKKDNILFAADVRETTWKPMINGEEYDARSYRFTGSNKLILQAADSGSSISVTPTDSTLKQVLSSIDKKHDCICPLNLSDYKLNDNTVSKYKFKSSSEQSLVLGGTGLNIDYEFITTDIMLDTTLDYNFMSVPRKQDEGRVIYQVSDGSSTVVKYPEVKQRIPNYCDPYIDSKYKGYQRDEIYRFGIIFFNNKNVASPVYWIADIKFPHSFEVSPWYFYMQFVNGDLTNSITQEFIGKAIGVKFNIKNFPDGAVAYEIVRCKRTAEDRTVLMQGILSDTTAFPWPNATTGTWLKSEMDTRPRIPLGVTDTNMSICGGVSFYDAPTTYRDGELYLNQDRIVKNIFSLITPEIDFTGDEVISELGDNTYLDLCHWCDTRMPNTTRTIPVLNNQNIKLEGFVKYFQTPYQTYAMNTQTAYVQPSFLGSIFKQDGFFYNAVNMDSSDDDEMVVNMIGKRYITHYQNLQGGNRIQFDINRAITTPIIPNGELGNIQAYYRGIGSRSYLNFGVMWNNQEQFDWLSAKMCYFGSCAVVELDGYFPRQHSIAVDDKIAVGEGVKSLINFYNHTPFSTPVVNIKRRIVPYGGNNYNARSNSTYISTSSYKLISEVDSNVNYVFGGDTYLGVLDHRTGSPIADGQGGGKYDSRQTKVSLSDYIPLETTINLNLAYGESMSRQRGNCPNPYLTNYIHSLGFSNQTKPYYAYNDVYSLQPSTQMYVADSTTSMANLRLPNKIIYSETKTANEITDSWAQFKPANYMEVDSQYGPVTNMKAFGDKLFFWQDSALGIASVNDRSLITDNNVSTLTLGTGGILTRYDYVSTNNGSSISNDQSIVASDASLYWYDTDKNEICSFSDRIHKLSKEKNVQTYLNNNPDIQVRTSIYDNKFNEVQMCFDNAVLVFNEYTQRFTSFYTFNPKAHLRFSDKLLYIYNNKIMENADFPLNTMQSKLQYVVNKDPLVTKTFDNVFFSGQFRDINSMLIDAKFTTKNQVGTIQENYLTGGYAIDYREDTYRFAIGREDIHEDELSLPGRLRGKYLICDYTINCDNQHNFNLPNINTTYRYSLV